MIPSPVSPLRSLAVLLALVALVLWESGGLGPNAASAADATTAGPPVAPTLPPGAYPFPTASFPPATESQEGALVGGDYRVGPGDEIAVSIWGEIPVTHSLRVTPEGRLLIPLVGEIFVNAMGMPEVRRAVLAATGRVYRNVEVTVTLVGLRTFKVHVVGEVERPGTYEARAVERVSTILNRAGGMPKTAGSRRIEVRNADSLRAIVDLLRFERLGDLTGNPLVSDGDLIFVPLLRERVSVFGSVRRPGEVELVPSDRLPEIVALAGGLGEGAVVDSVVISGYAADGVAAERRTIFALEPGVSEAAALPAVALESDNRVFLRRRPKFHEDNLITLEGDVLYPGVYDISPGQTTLAEIIARAGGFLSTAALEEAELVRTAGENEPDRELLRLAKIQPSEMSPEEYDYVRARSRLREGWMAIDFVRLFRRGDASQDIPLEPGDRIRVPRQRNFVKVIGRVLRPGNVTYSAGADADYYIHEAGGYTWDARKGRVRVINGLTGQRVKKNDVKVLNPGDTVWVPEKPNRDYGAMVKSAISFLTGLATIYLVVDTAANR